MLKYAKIVNEDTKQVIVGLGNDIESYKSIGMTEMDVEEAYNGDWYLIGYIPQELSNKGKVRKAKQYLNETDYVVTKISEAIADEDIELVKELKEKYKDIIMKRKECRIIISELENT